MSFSRFLRILVFYTLGNFSAGFSLGKVTSAVACHGHPRRPLCLSNYEGGGFDPNAWRSSDDEDSEAEEINWMERLSRLDKISEWESSYDDDDDEGSDVFELEDDDGEDDDREAEAWLEMLASISADEVTFMETEAERADMQRRMQEEGFSSEAIGNTLGLTTNATQRELDVQGEDAIVAAFQNEIAETGFGMMVGEEDDPMEVDSHLKVEMDNETGEPAEGRTQMVYVDEVTCIGCTNCAMIAQSTFGMEPEHGRARVFEQWGDDDETIAVAIETCPVDCIHYVPFEELVRLELERRGQKINFKARLVNTGGGTYMGPKEYSAPQKISGNMGSRCNNCPSRGCKNCPMFGVGKNPEFEKKEKARLERRRLQSIKKQMASKQRMAEL